MIFYQMDMNFKNIVRENLLRKLPVKFEDVTNTLSFFGPDLSGVREKQ